MPPPSAAPKRWTLPGPCKPYLILQPGDERVKKTPAGDFVPAATVLEQLDNWAVSRADLLQDMRNALSPPPEAESKETPKPGMTGQLKQYLTAQFNAGKLLVLEVPREAPVAPAPTRKVTYTFNFTTSSGLSMPYAVAIDGQVMEPYAEKPGIIRGGKVSVDVPMDSTVCLYLNSDAHPDHRKSPVYGISPRERDIQVSITEKLGKTNNNSDVPRFVKTSGGKGKETDTYEVLLTGALWMNVSYRYTEEDAKGHLPASLDPKVREAILRIYRGELKNKLLKVEWPALAGAPQGTSPKQELSLDFDGSNNPTQNIEGFNLLTDGLTRMHPKTFVVLFEAARSASLTYLNLTSNWRPLLGSIAHRAGLGMDVGEVVTAQNVRVLLNRKELSDSTAKEGPHVTAKEKELLGAYWLSEKQARNEETAFQASAKAASPSESEWKAAQKRLSAAQNAKGKLKATPEQLATLQEDVTKTSKAAEPWLKARDEQDVKRKAAIASRNKAMADWSWNSPRATSQP